MTQTQGSLARQITDYAHRADPYPIYAELRKTPVVHDEEGPYIVSTYWEIHGLLHDPRLSSEARNLDPEAAPELVEEDDPGLPPSFLRLDPPEHDRLRRLAMAPFGPPHTPRRLHAMRGELTRIVGELIDGFEGRDRIDLVDHFSYPFPVTVICRLLGVPREDEPRFHTWADTLAASLDPDPDADAAERRRITRQARTELAMYLSELMEERRRAPRDDMLSALVGGQGPEERMSRAELLSTAALLLVAGHETTVNLITNGMLTLLRNPDVLARLRKAPHLVVPLVEELLRFDPPVQMLPQRTPLSEIDIAGVTIPKGASVWLLLASGNRDPQRFPDPDRFDPRRRDNQHLGFGSGIHSCFGAPLARLEAQIALTELARRLVEPRLLEDPPTYRHNAVLRGPRHLPIALEGLRPKASPNGSSNGSSNGSPNGSR
ncbi:cytochrome P450 [Streptomyces sp. 4503]|uniref:Cytochrome P450 n=1 Tax=Streptomyces niphimycinicus TaxID=2842201 RepID=A0ABS6CP81_9ACTN|nr:cytochrome P450 [Streptomyces niphimycinicus]MBU3868762.1 cytochrome P450 [Streptomyces niphimycinicus]